MTPERGRLVSPSGFIPGPWKGLGTRQGRLYLPSKPCVPAKPRQGAGFGVASKMHGPDGAAAEGEGMTLDWYRGVDPLNAWYFAGSFRPFYSCWVMKHITLDERYASFVRRLEAARKRNGLE